MDFQPPLKFNKICIHEQIVFSFGYNIAAAECYSRKAQFYLRDGNDLNYKYISLCDVYKYLGDEKSMKSCKIIKMLSE